MKNIKLNKLLMYGKMTILGGSRVSEDICQQMNIGASHFFEVKGSVG